MRQTHYGLFAVALILALQVITIRGDDTLNDFTSSPPSTNGPFWYFTEAPKGGLVEVTYSSTVGVLLDDVPMNIRERVAQYYLNQPESFWNAKAKLQGFMLEYQQVFRLYVANELPEDFNPPIGGLERSLTVTPEELWQFNFDPQGPKRVDLSGHDYILYNFTFYGVLVTADVLANWNLSSPNLATINGTATLFIHAPIEPEYTFQRAGYACADEATFTWDNTVDSENYWVYYDHYCEVEPYRDVSDPEQYAQAGCHYSGFPNMSCIDALKAYEGGVDVTILWRRIEWNETLAAEWRYGENKLGVVNLEKYDVSTEDNKVAYRYIPKNSCSIKEDCVGSYGWRRLLDFGSTSLNTGSVDAVLGYVYQDFLQSTGWLQYAPCHHHEHNNYFLNYTFASREGEKKGFCMQSTWRYHNNELTPLATWFDTCWFQGVSPGWGDDYFAGIPCQWKDVTDSPNVGTHSLIQQHNPEGLLCEGVPDLDVNGSHIYVPSGIINGSGFELLKQKCNQAVDWNADNTGGVTITVPPRGSYVTEACMKGEFGEIRNCGYQVLEQMMACVPGSVVSFTARISDLESPQAIRICESSIKLGTSTYCGYNDALASRTLTTGRDEEVSFICPVARDEVEVGGFYSILSAPFFPVDGAQTIAMSMNACSCPTPECNCPTCPGCPDQASTNINFYFADMLRQ